MIGLLIQEEIHTAQSMSVNCLKGTNSILTDLFLNLFIYFCRDTCLALCIFIFGFKGIEFTVWHDLSDSGYDNVIISKNGCLKLDTVYTFFYNDVCIILRSFFQLCHQIFLFIAAVTSNTGSGTACLDKARHSKFFHNRSFDFFCLFHVFFHYNQLSIIALLYIYRFDLWDSCTFKYFLCKNLIHTCTGCKYTASYIRKLCQFK